MSDMLKQKKLFLKLTISEKENDNVFISMHEQRIDFQVGKGKLLKKS